MAQKVGSFMKGLLGEHATLDEVLAGKVVDKQYRLIDLKRANVSYDKTSETITIHRPDIANSVHVPVRAAFHDYMDKYADSVRYVTRNGTPWLTDAEKDNPQKVEDYFTALKSGPKQDVATVNWQKTESLPNKIGHAAVSIGELELEDEIGADGKPIDPRHIDNYEQHAGGSFYPSPSMWRDRKAMEQSKLRDTGENDPSSHARGVLIRNTIKPTATAAAAGVAAAAAVSGKKRGFIRTALRAATVASATYAGGYLVGSFQTSPGSIKIKDETEAHGALAVLVSPSQHDILEHSLVGLSRTYHGEYNVMKSNCADFAEDIMGLVGINTKELVQTAMETQPACEVNPSCENKKTRKTLGERAIPHHIRPDRFSRAMQQLKSGEEGLVDIDGQELCLQKFEVSGQSALLVEAADGEKFKNPPLETLSMVLTDGVGVTAPKGPSRAEFAFSSAVKTPQVGASR